MYRLNSSLFLRFLEIEDVRLWCICRSMPRLATSSLFRRLVGIKGGVSSCCACCCGTLFRLALRLKASKSLVRSCTTESGICTVPAAMVMVVEDVAAGGNVPSVVLMDGMPCTSLMVSVAKSSHSCRFFVHASTSSILLGYSSDSASK